MALATSQIPMILEARGIFFQRILLKLVKSILPVSLYARINDSFVSDGSPSSECHAL